MWLKMIVNEFNAETLLGFINSLVESEFGHRPIRLLDIQTGLGRFVKYNESNQDYVIIGCEGNPNLKARSVTQNVILHDIVKKTLDINVDVTTSFNIAEHVREEDQYMFWNNISKLGRFHFCSIGVCEDHDDSHKFIRRTDWWVSYFINKFGIQDIWILQRPGKHIANTDLYRLAKIPCDSAVFLIEW